MDFLYRLATALEMRLNHEYWCECTWQTNSINKTATSDRLDYWASRHPRGFELVFKSLDCFTVWLFHSATNFFQPGWLLAWRVFFFFFFGGGGVRGWAQLQRIYYLVLFTNLKAAEGILMFQTSLLWYHLVIESALWMLMGWWLSTGTSTAKNPD